MIEYVQNLGPVAAELMRTSRKGSGGVTVYSYFSPPSGPGGRRQGVKVATARTMGETLGEVTVAPKFRRTGVGSYVVNDLRALGIRGAYAGSPAGEALLRKSGMQETDPGHYRFNPSGEQGYEQFHGKTPRRKGSVDLHTPRQLVLLGEAVAVEYRCNKLNGGGDGTKAVYRHKFDKGAILAMDETNRRQLYIIGSKIKVTDAGIEH